MGLFLDYFEKKNWKIREYKFWIKFASDMVFIGLFVMILLTVRGIIEKSNSCYPPPINYSFIDSTLKNESINIICECREISPSYNILNTYESNNSHAYIKATAFLNRTVG